MKSVLWRLAKRLSYLEDAGCLKVNDLITVHKTVYLMPFAMCLNIVTGSSSNLALTYKLSNSRKTLRTICIFYKQNFLRYISWHGGTAVKVLCYKSEGHWFDPRWCHWNFSLT